MSRVSTLYMLAVFLFGGIAFGADKHDLSVLVKEFITAKVHSKQISLIRNITRHENAAIHPAMTLYGAGRISNQQAVLLVHLLGQIGTAKAVKALTQILNDIDKGLIHYHKQKQKVAVIKALGEIDNDPALATLLAITPNEASMALIYIKALATHRREGVARRLSGYVLSSDNAVSTRASRVLRHYLASGIKARDINEIEETLREEGDAAIADLVSQVEDMDTEEVTGAICRQVMQACRALSDMQEKAGLYEQFLRSGNAVLREAALDILIHDKALIQNDDLRESLGAAMNNQVKAPGVKRLLALLGAIKNTRAKKLIPTIIPLLDHKNAKVRVRATEVMAFLSGECLGRNPEVWKKWYAAKLVGNTPPKRNNR